MNIGVACIFLNYTTLGICPRVDPYQITHDIFNRTNTPKRKQSRRHNLPKPQIILQGYNNQNIMLLAQKQIYESM